MAKKPFVFDLLEQHKRGGGYGPLLLGALGEAEKLAKDFQTRREAISIDRLLTSEGKAAALRDAARTALEAIGKWHAPHRDGFDEREKFLVNELRAAVMPQRSSDPADRFEAALLRAEVRRAAAGLSEMQITWLYQQGDAVTRSALEEVQQIIPGEGGSIRVAPFVSPEVRDEVLLEAGARLFPDRAELLNKNRTGREVVGSIVGALTAMVREADPDAFLSPIRVS